MSKNHKDKLTVGYSKKYAENYKKIWKTEAKVDERKDYFSECCDCPVLETDKGFTCTQCGNSCNVYYTETVISFEPDFKIKDGGEDE